jgi:glutamyl-tRNA synthetase
VPVWAHIPLIHGPDGKKLSKRHGALGRRWNTRHGLPGGGDAQLPRAAGLEPWRRRALHRRQALEWFDLDGIGKAPARLDMKKLDSVAAWHIARMEDASLLRR